MTAGGGGKPSISGMVAQMASPVPMTVVACARKKKNRIFQNKRPCRKDGMERLREDQSVSNW